ncbi:MAG TPA: ANTAR domain-containing protein [Propionibacteriaceae bacterium]|nr:ANTAR domain-containing protein [Propionibacteriaceae bacterium]
MERFQISSDEAFRMLVRWSKNSNVKLRAVAAQLVWSGELPMGGGASRNAAQGAAGLNASGLLGRPARAG